MPLPRAPESGEEFVRAKGTVPTPGKEQTQGRGGRPAELRRVFEVFALDATGGDRQGKGTERGVGVWVLSEAGGQAWAIMVGKKDS